LLINTETATPETLITTSTAAMVTVFGQKVFVLRIKAKTATML